MSKHLAKAAVAMLAGLGLAAAVASTPAQAATYFHGGGWGGGWHGGGWGGGWRPGWGGGWRPGWGGGYWRGGYWNGGWGGGYWGGGYWGPGWGYAGWGYPWWGWGVGPVVAGDAYYASNANGCWMYRRVWSQPGGRGRYLGRHFVNICQ